MLFVVREVTHSTTPRECDCRNSCRNNEPAHGRASDTKWSRDDTNLNRLVKRNSGLRSASDAIAGSGRGPADVWRRCRRIPRRGFYQSPGLLAKRATLGEKPSVEILPRKGLLDFNPRHSARPIAARISATTVGTQLETSQSGDACSLVRRGVGSLTTPLG